MPVPELTVCVVPVDFVTLTEAVVLFWISTETSVVVFTVLFSAPLSKVIFTLIAVSIARGIAEVISVFPAVFSTATGTDVSEFPSIASLTFDCTLTFSTMPPSFMVSTAFACVSVLRKIIFSIIASFITLIWAATAITINMFPCAFSVHVLFLIALIVISLKTPLFSMSAFGASITNAMSLYSPSGIVNVSAAVVSKVRERVSFAFKADSNPSCVETVNSSGFAVGATVGSIVGSVVGSTVGSLLGANDGSFVGSFVGANDGSFVGSVVGTISGLAVSLTIVFFFTVTLHFKVYVFALTFFVAFVVTLHFIVDLPALIPFTTPAFVTVATFVFEELHL